jgi:NAD(P)-dependent dehydrogenase (short-subunit alcohol dehydrogenase family)
MTGVLAAGAVELLVNNAAIAINGPFMDAKTDDFDKIYAVNVRRRDSRTWPGCTTKLAQR